MQSREMKALTAKLEELDKKIDLALVTVKNLDRRLAGYGAVQAAAPESVNPEAAAPAVQAEEG